MPLHGASSAVAAVLTRSATRRATISMALATAACGALGLALLDGGVVLARGAPATTALRVVAASSAILVPLALAVAAALGTALARALEPRTLAEALADLWRAPSGPLAGRLAAALCAAILFLPIYRVAILLVERSVQSAPFRSLCAVLAALGVWALAWTVGGAVRTWSVAARPRPRWILVAGAAVTALVLGAAIAFHRDAPEASDALLPGAALAGALGGALGLAFSMRRGSRWPIALTLVLAAPGAWALSSAHVRLVLASESVLPRHMQALLPSARPSAAPERAPALFAAVAPASLVARRPIVLVTLEGVTAGALGLHGYRRATSPNLDRWASAAVVFDAATAQSAQTRLSVPSLLVGRYPSQLAMTGPEGISAVERAADVTLAERLSAVGYHTVAVPGRRGSIGTLEGSLQGFVEKSRARGAKGVADSAGRQLVRARRRHVPTFLWLQFDDASAPPYPRVQDAPAWSRRDRAIWGIDRELGRVFREIDRKLGARDPLVIVTALATGDARSALDVPLIVRMRGLPPRRVDGAVALLDVVPTVLDLVGVPARERLEGRSLVPELLGQRSQPDRVVLAELEVRDPRVDPMAARTEDLLVLEDPLSGPAQAWALPTRAAAPRAARVPAALRRRIAAHAARMSAERDAPRGNEEAGSP